MGQPRLITKNKHEGWFFQILIFILPFNTENRSSSSSVPLRNIDRIHLKSAVTGKYFYSGTFFFVREHLVIRPQVDNFSSTPISFSVETTLLADKQGKSTQLDWMIFSFWQQFIMYINLYNFIFLRYYYHLTTFIILTWSIMLFTKTCNSVSPIVAGDLCRRVKSTFWVILKLN